MRKKKKILGETGWLEADNLFPCHEDVVKIPDSRLPTDVASLLCFPSVGKGSRVPWCIVTRSWALQGQGTNTRIPSPHSPHEEGMSKGNTSWAPTKSDKFVILFSQFPAHQLPLLKIWQGSSFWFGYGRFWLHLPSPKPTSFSWDHLLSLLSVFCWQFWHWYCFEAQVNTRSKFDRKVLLQRIMLGMTGAISVHVGEISCGLLKRQKAGRLSLKNRKTTSSSKPIAMWFHLLLQLFLSPLYAPLTNGFFFSSFALLYILSIHTGLLFLSSSLHSAAFCAI